LDAYIEPFKNSGQSGFLMKITDLMIGVMETIEGKLMLLLVFGEQSLIDFRDRDGSFASDDGDDGGRLHHADSMDEVLNYYKLPADPWVLRVRWRKEGMYPPGTVPPGSTHSSQVDLRRHSIASLSSAGGSLPSHEGFTSTHHTVAPTDAVVMHLDIQLYEMEPGVYLVDFKCAGYETAEGTLLEEKEVTSPFPFLDLASKLIIQLAEAD
jgi:carbon catabolite-derepressing protein kinase